MKIKTLTPVLYFNGESEGFQVEVALQYNDGYSDNILSFVNNVRTKDGGNPRNWTQDSHYQGHERLCKKNRTSQRKRQEPEGSDYREGLSAVLSILVQAHLQFERADQGQTRKSTCTTSRRRDCR